jgi:hypothetical protein
MGKLNEGRKLPPSECRRDPTGILILVDMLFWAGHIDHETRSVPNKLDV